MKKVISILFVVIVISISLVFVNYKLGTNTNESSANESNSNLNTPKPTPVITRNEAGGKIDKFGKIIHDNPADAGPMFEKLTLNGRPIKMGVPLDQFGVFSDCKWSEPIDVFASYPKFSGTFTTELYCKGEPVQSVDLSYYTKLGKKSPVYKISQDIEYPSWRLEVDGIGLGNTAEEMMSRLGTPSINADSIGDSYLYCDLDTYSSSIMFHVERTSRVIDNVLVKHSPVDKFLRNR